MIKRKIWIYCLVLVTGLGMAGLGYSSVTGVNDNPPEYEITIKTQEGDHHDFNIELAVNAEQQRKGLMFRTELMKDSGMLFIFDTVAPRSFWMRNTLIPLDIIFVEADGKIQHIHSNAKPQDDTYITSGKPVKAVLEINGGQADTLGITAGDYIHHPAFNNMNLLNR